MSDFWDNLDRENKDFADRLKENSEKISAMNAEVRQDAPDAEAEKEESGSAWDTIKETAAETAGEVADAWVKLRKTQELDRGDIFSDFLPDDEREAAAVSFDSKYREEASDFAGSFTRATRHEMGNAIDEAAEAGGEMAQGFRDTEAFLDYFMSDEAKAKKARDIEQMTGISADGILGDDTAYKAALGVYDYTKKLKNVMGDKFTMDAVWKEYPELRDISAMSANDAVIALNHMDEVRTTHGIIDSFRTMFEYGDKELQYNNLQYKIMNGEATEEEKERAAALETELKEQSKKLPSFFDEPLSAIAGGAVGSLPMMKQSFDEALADSAAFYMAAVGAGAAGGSILPGVGTAAGVMAGNAAGVARFGLLFLENIGKLAKADTAAKSIARYAARYGMLEGMRKPTTGGYYAEYGEMKDKNGKPLLTDEERRGYAVIAGALNSGIEMLDFDVVKGAVLGRPQAAKIIKEIIDEAKDSKAAKETLLEFAKTRVKDVLKVTGGEMSEEMAQSVADDLVHNDIERSTGDTTNGVYSWQDIAFNALQSGLEAAPGSLGFGLMSGGSGTITGGIGRAVGHRYEAASEYGKRKRETMLGVGMYEQIQAKLHDSKLKQDAPEVSQKLLRSQLAGTGYETVYVDTEMAMEKENGAEELKKIAKAAGISDDELNQAIEQKGTLTIAGEQFAQVDSSPDIFDSVSFSPEADSMARMKHDAENIKNQMLDMQKRIIDSQQQRLEAVLDMYVKDDGTAETKEKRAAMAAVVMQNPESPATAWNDIHAEYADALDEVIAPAMDALCASIDTGEMTADVTDKKGNKKTVHYSKEAPWYKNFYEAYKREPTEDELRDMAVRMMTGDETAPHVAGFKINQNEIAAVKPTIEAARKQLATLDAIKDTAKSLTGAEMQLTEGMSKEGFRLYRILTNILAGAPGRAARAARMNAILLVRHADIYAKLMTEKTGKPYTPFDYVRYRIGLQFNSNYVNIEEKIAREADAAAAEAIKKARATEKERRADADEGTKKEAAQEEKPAPKIDIPYGKPVEGAEGKETVVVTDEGTEVKARYKLVNVDDVITSNKYEGNTIVENKKYPAALQPRKRGERKGMRAQTDSMANSLRPEDLGESRNLNQGAPVIRKDGVVLNGNGRSMAIAHAYEMGNESSKTYIDYIAAHAEKFGLSKEDVQKAAETGKHMMLVREIGKVDAGVLDEVINSTTGGATMGAAEQAEIDARHINGRDFDTYDVESGGDLTTAGNRVFITKLLYKLVSKNDINRYTDKNGSINADGIKRVRNAIFALAYIDGDAISKMAESTDDAIKNVSNGLMAAAANIARLAQKMKEGSAHEYALSESIAEAVKKYNAIKEGRAEKNVDAYVLENETSLMGGGDSPEVVELVKTFEEYKRSGKRIGTFLNNLAAVIAGTGNPIEDETALFGGEYKLPTLAEAIEVAKKKTDDAYGAIQAENNANGVFNELSPFVDIDEEVPVLDFDTMADKFDGKKPKDIKEYLKKASSAEPIPTADFFAIVGLPDADDRYSRKHIVMGTSQRRGAGINARNKTLSNLRQVLRKARVIEVCPNTKVKDVDNLKGERRARQERKNKVKRYFRIMVPVKFNNKLYTLTLIAEDKEGGVFLDRQHVTLYEIKLLKNRGELPASPTRRQMSGPRNSPLFGYTISNSDGEVKTTIRNMLTGMKDAEGNLFIKDNEAHIIPGDSFNQYAGSNALTANQEALTTAQTMLKDGVLFQEQRQNIKGVTNVDRDGRRIISLMETADESTFLHEMGHVFLLDLEDLAKIDETSAKELAAVKEWAAWHKGDAKKYYSNTPWAREFNKREKDILAAYNAGDTMTYNNLLRVWEHERFARAFEMYLRDGKAPARGLRGVFRKFKQYLRQIYIAFAGDGGRASKDVQRVMARMIATDEEINEMSLDDRFEDVEKAGGEKLFNEDERETYERWQEEAKEEAKEKLMKSVMKDLSEKKQKEFDERVEKEKARKERELQNETEYLAFEALKASGDKDIVLNWYPSYEAFEEAYAKAGSMGDVLESHMDRYRKTLDNELMNAYLTEEAVTKAMESGEYHAKLEGLVAAALGRKLSIMKKITSKTEQAMQSVEDKLATLPEDKDIKVDRHSAPVDRLMRAISELRFSTRWSAADYAEIEKMVNASTKEEIAEALKALRDQSRSDALNEKTVLEANEGRMAIYRMMAEESMKEKELADAVNVRKWRNQEKNAARRVMVAIKAKNWELAVHMQEQKAMAAEMAKVAEKMKDDVDKKLKRIKKQLSTKSVKIAKDERYWHRHLAYLLRIANKDAVKPAPEIVKDKEGKPIRTEGLKNLGDLFKEMEASLDVTAAPADILEKAAAGGENFRGWRSLNIGEFDKAVDALTILYTVGRDKFKLKTIGGKDIVDVLNEIMAESEDADAGGMNVDAKKVNDDEGGLGYNSWIARVPGIGQAIARHGQKYIAVTMKPEEILWSLGNAAHKYIYGTYERAVTREAERIGKAVTDLRAIVGVYTHKEKREWKKQQYVIETGSGREMLSKENVLAMALNLGTRSNVQRLVDGLGMSEMEVRRFINSHMTEKDWIFVQNVWDYLGTFWPETVEVEEKLNGVTLEAKKPEGFIASVGDKGIHMRGGYYPIEYHPEKSIKAQNQAENMEAQRSMTGAQVLETGRSFTRKRAQYVARPLLLELSVIPDHVQQVIHNIEVRIPARDVYRLVYSKAMEDKVTSTLGRDYYKVLTEWATDVWNIVPSDNNQATGLFNRVLGAMRRNSVMAIMGYRLWPVIENASNIGPVMDKLGAVHGLNAVANFYANLDANRDLLNKSVFMRDRINSMDRDIRQQPGLFEASARPFEIIRDHAYDMMLYSDLALSAPLWVQSFKDSFSLMLDAVTKENEKNQNAVLRAQEKVSNARAALVDRQYADAQKKEQEHVRTMSGAVLADEAAQGMGENDAPGMSSPFDVKRYGEENVQHSEIVMEPEDDVPFYDSNPKSEAELKKELQAAENEFDKISETPILSDMEIIKEAEKRAIEKADAAVRDTFGSGRAMDLASIQRQKSEAMKMMTVFYSFFNTQFNAIFAAYRHGKYGAEPEGTIRRWAPFARSVMYRVVVMSLVGCLLKFALGVDGSDDKDRWRNVTDKDGNKIKEEIPALERFLKMFGKNTLSQVAGSFVFARDIVNMGINYVFDGTTYGRGLNPMESSLRVLTEIGKTVDLLARKGKKDLELEEKHAKEEARKAEKLRRLTGSKRAEYLRKLEEEEKYKAPDKRITYSEIARHGFNALSTATATATGISNTLVDAVTGTMQYLNDTDNRYDVTWKNIIWSAVFDKKPVEREIPARPPKEEKKNKNKKK